MEAFRTTELEKLKKEVEECESKLNLILENFGWNKEGLSKRQPKIKETNENSFDDCLRQKKCENDSVEDCSSTSSRINSDLSELMDLSAIVERNKDLSKNFADLNKLKRDLKRRRMKYRTTKCPTLTYTEEMRELIGNLTEIEVKRRRTDNSR